MKRLRSWWYSLVLLVCYLAIFHLWMRLDRPGILAAAAIMTAVLAGLQYGAFRSGYFRNHWDNALHASVILDVALEGALIPVHDNRGFYLCALAFAVVIVGYRHHVARWRPV